MPAGFFHHLAVQGGNGMLAGVYPPTGQLKFGRRRRLMRNQKPVPIQQNRIDPRPSGIAAAHLRRVSIAFDHADPLALRLL